MARLYRQHPDSSVLETPRVFVRVFAAPGTLVDTVRFYKALTTMPVDQDMDFPETGLHVVAVGAFLILEIDPTKLDRAEQAAKTTVTVLVADLDDTTTRQVAAGAEVAQQRWTSPPGSGVRLRHPDGLLVEYVEHRPSPDDVDQPAPAFR